MASFRNLEGRTMRRLPSRCFHSHYRDDIWLAFKASLTARLASVLVDLHVIPIGEMHCSLQNIFRCNIV